MAKLTLSSIGLGDYPPYVIQYAQYLKSISMRSELTVCEYLLDLRTFFRYLCACDMGRNLSEDLSDIDFSRIPLERLDRLTTDDLTSFIFFLDDQRNNHAAAKKRKIAALRSFFGYMFAKKHLLSSNPAADLEGPAAKQGLPKYLNLEDSLLLLSTVLHDTSSKNRHRDYAIITLFLNCGLRLSELCGINMNDIDDRHAALVVTGKGNKKREVFLNDACRAALDPYLAERASLPPEISAQKALFLSSRGTRISNKSVQAMVYKYLDMAGLGDRGLSVHKLRHTAATLMYQEGGVDVRTLQELLGHAQLNTTQIYTHVSNQNVMEAIRHNPLANVRMEEDEKIDGEQSDESDDV